MHFAPFQGCLVEKQCGGGSIFPLTQEKAKQKLPHSGAESSSSKGKPVQVYLSPITPAPPSSTPANPLNLLHSGIWGSEPWNELSGFNDMSGLGGGGEEKVGE